MKCYRCDNWPCTCKDGQTIINGDCREILPELEPVALVLTDPPYGIGIAANPVRQKHAKSSWDDKPVDGELLEAVIGKGEYAVVWGGNYFGLPPNQFFLVWDKCQPDGLTLSQCEYAWSNKRQPARLFSKSVLSYKKQHPTQKPVELMAWCLGFFPAAETVLDPFMGSGTTLRACKDAARRGIGIEREEKYCEIAANRLRQEVLFS
jgi:site-specific DNA-methyltransferase (adenine-specific)